MLKLAQIDELEKSIGQLDGLHSELASLSKKSPNDAVNSFKLRFVNGALSKCNSFLREDYRPFEEFDQFSEDDVPSNSDVTLMLSQYMQQLERFRSDNIHLEYGTWYYKTEDSDEKIRTWPPIKLKRK